MKRKIKIMLVEDSPAYRKVIDQSLEENEDIELISQFSTAESALNSLQDMSTRHVPDIILQDISLPGMNGTEAIPLFKKSIPSAKIIMLTQSNSEADVLTAIQNGASGYLLKSSTLAQLTDGIKTVMEGGASLDSKIAIYIIEQMQTFPRKGQAEELLTKRELEVLTLIGDGFIKKEIATKLNISTKTVEAHVGHVYEKLEVQNAPAAVSRGHKLGLFRTSLI